MEHYAILAGFALETTPQDRGIGAPPAVSGAEADRLAAARSARGCRSRWWVTARPSPPVSTGAVRPGA
ncbi:hypothetical protein, partial [Streptomyces bohaiensis]|uniref:hypothetical protein n=1 Tax=Streptomyces bohaiensis TaxID=1431344 RepID=UPI001ADDC673